MIWNLLTACDRSCLSHLPRQFTDSLSSTAKQQMQQKQQCWDYSFYTSFGWPKFAYVTKPVPPETRRVTYKLHSQGRSCFRFFLYFTPHARHISLVTFYIFLSSFWCCYKRKSFQTASLSHFISLVRPAHHLFFVFFFIQPGTVGWFT